MRAFWNFGLKKPLSVENSEMSYGSLEIKDVESCEEDGGPACEVSKGSAKALYIRVIFYTEFRFCHCGQLGLKSQPQLTRDQHQ